MPAPILLLNCVGLTPRLLHHAPRLSAIAKSGWVANMPETLPAVTCTAQATLLTGKLPREHGIVANGWLFRDTMEVRFWQQSNRLIQAEPLYETAKKRNPKFKCAKLFWWFNQGAMVDVSVTPKPWYGIDGSKVFDVTGTPSEHFAKILSKYKSFPFASFWGPKSGFESSSWISRISAWVLTDHKPDLTMVYLPHLDYDPQRFGPDRCDMAKRVKELDDACLTVCHAAKEIGAKVWIVSEYGHCNVTTPVLPNVALRKAGLLVVRDGPFGEQLDTFYSRAIAVVDHQIMHIYVRDAVDIPKAVESLAPIADRILVGEERGDLAHPRSGEIIAFARPGEWFAYNFWLDDRKAPDYAHCVAIHHKPGFDPCELFFDPKLRFPKLHAARRLIQKKLGFRTLFDVCPLDPSIVRGSHGLAAADPLDRPILIGHGSCPGASAPMTSVRDLILNALGLGE